MRLTTWARDRAALARLRRTGYWCRCPVGAHVTADSSVFGRFPASPNTTTSRKVTR